MSTLADDIIDENIPAIQIHLQSGVEVNDVDEYGFTPLIEAAIADNFEIAKLLLDYRADVNMQDMTGGTALHWAAENNNLELAQLLLNHGANPNAYTLAGQPVLVMPLLRQQQQLKSLLLENGAVLSFAQDFINAKLLGHMFELVGKANIVDVQNEFIELDFEGFILEFTIGLISDSLEQFKNHYAARQLRRYASVVQIIIEVLQRASQLMKYQQYRVNLQNFQFQIDTLLQQEPILIPIGYEGHAITFIKMKNILIKCDRREESRLYDNIVFYQMAHPEVFTADFIKHMMYEPQTFEFINEELHHVLGLHPMMELKVSAQISGNCSWANVEAVIPAIFFLLCSSAEDFHKNIVQYKNVALNFFQQWREWNQDRALHACIESFKYSDTLRRTCKAEILGAILFQTATSEETRMKMARVEDILSVLMQPEYEYVLKNYVTSYCYEDIGKEGKAFLQLLKRYGYKA